MSKSSDLYPKGPSIMDLILALTNRVLALEEAASKKK